MTWLNFQLDWLLNSKMDSVLTVMMNLRYARIFEQGRVEYENIYTLLIEI